MGDSEDRDLEAELAALRAELFHVRVMECCRSTNDAYVQFLRNCEVKYLYLHTIDFTTL